MKISFLISLAGVALACDSCYGPLTDVVHERNVRRMQPQALNATVGPKAPLEWGQINFLHTASLPKLVGFMMLTNNNRLIRMAGSKVT